MVIEYKESDLDTGPKNVLPIEAAQGLALLLVILIVICFATAVWFLK